MKRIWIFLIILAMSLGLLSGCGSQKKPSGALSICVDSNVLPEMFIAPILAEFEHANPEIRVETTYLPAYKSDDPAIIEVRTAALNRARTELMSGQGADIYLFRGLHGFSDTSDSYMLFPDLERNILSGAFHNLDFLFEDPRFNPEDYVPALTTTGVWEGKSYVLPLNYQVKGLVGIDAAMTARGVDATPPDLTAFVDQLLDLGDDCPYLHIYSDVLITNSLATPLVSIQDADILLDEPQWQIALDQARRVRLARAEEPEDMAAFLDYSTSVESGAALLPGGSVAVPFQTMRHLEQAGNTARFLCVPNETGGVTAQPDVTAVVSAGCQTEAAAEFLIFLLGETVQGCRELPYIGTPANLSFLGATWPVRKGCGREMLEGLTMANLQPGPISDTMNADLEAMENRVNTIRIPSRYDASFYSLVEDYLSGEQSWEECWTCIQAAWSYLDE